MGHRLATFLPIAIAMGLAGGTAAAQQAVPLRPTYATTTSDADLAATNTLASGDGAATGIVQPPDGEQLQAEQTDLTIAPPGVPEAPPPRRKRRTPQEDPYVPLGLRTGGLTFYPEWETGVVVTDNVAQSQNDRRSAVGLALRPRLRVESDWPRHRFTAEASGEKTFYRKYSNYDDASANASALLSLDIRRTTRLDIGAAYSLDQTGPSSFDVPNNADGRRNDQTISATAALVHTFNRLTATLRTGVAWALYGDVDLAGGGKEDNSDRDYISPRPAIRLAYEMSPVLSPFIDIEYDPRFHFHKPDRNGYDRDSHGIVLRAGTTINNSALWDGSVALRYDFRTYEDNALDNVSVVGAEASLNWHPTRLTTVTFTANSGIDESFSGTSNGVRDYDAGVAVVHALRDNIELSSGFTYSLSDYQGTSDDDQTYVARLGLSYALNRNTAVTAGYEFTRFDSGSPGSNYTEHLASAGLRFRL